MQMNVTIDMEEYTEDSLIDQIAQNIINYQVGPNVQKILKEKMDAAIEKQLNEAAQVSISEIIEAKINEGIQKTNWMGEPTGEKTSLKEMILKKAEEFMHEEVNDRGEKSGYRDSKQTRTEWYVKKYAKEGLDKAIKAEIDGIKQKAIDSVKDTVAGLMAEKLAKKCDPLSV